MKKLFFLIILFCPAFAFGQTFAGNYRAILFNFFSEPKTIIADFEVKADNSLNGRVKIGEQIQVFSGTVEKNGKFEAVSEREGEMFYKLKGRFDQNNKISFIQRTQKGSGLNKSVSENGIEGTFAKVTVTKPKVETPNDPSQPQVELTDNGNSQMKIQQSNPLFETDWSDFTALVSFGNSTKTPVSSESRKIIGTADASDYFVLRAKSKVEGQQSLTISVPYKSPDQKIWRQNQLRTVSYREINGDDRNTFLASAMLQTDPRYANGTLEIVSETETRIVFKLTDFKIKRLIKEDFATINGYVYADKSK